MPTLDPDRIREAFDKYSDEDLWVVFNAIYGLLYARSGAIEHVTATVIIDDTSGLEVHPLAL